MDTSCPIDLRASVTALPFADESLDYIYSNSLFEHVAYPHEIIREAFRVLRPGGALMTKVPFHFVEHRFPADYLRLSEQFFEEVCGAAGFDQVLTESEHTSGIYYIGHMFMKAGIIDDALPDKFGAQTAHIIMTMMMACLVGWDDMFKMKGRSVWHTTTALAIKPGAWVPRATAPSLKVPFVDRYLDALICPRSGLPLRKDAGGLVSIDGANRYDIINGIPDLFEMHGFGSSFRNRASARAARAHYENGKA